MRHMICGDLGPQGLPGPVHTSHCPLSAAQVPPADTLALLLQPTKLIYYGLEAAVDRAGPAHLRV